KIKWEAGGRRCFSRWADVCFRGGFRDPFPINVGVELVCIVPPDSIQVKWAGTRRSRPNELVLIVRSSFMSGASAEQYYPGLEGVIASETAIANIEGRDGAGGLEYRGYGIEDLAGRVSYEETAFLLLHGDLPNREQLRDFEARLRRSRSIPEALVTLYHQ